MGVGGRGVFVVGAGVAVGGGGVAVGGSGVLVASVMRAAVAATGVSVGAGSGVEVGPQPTKRKRDTAKTITFFMIHPSYSLTHPWNSRTAGRMNLSMIWKGRASALSSSRLN